MPNEEPACNDVVNAFEEQVRAIVADDVRRGRTFEQQLADIRAWAQNMDLRYEPADEGLTGADAVRNELDHIHRALQAQKASICATY